MLKDKIEWKSVCALVTKKLHSSSIHSHWLFHELPLSILKSSECANVIQLSTQFSSPCNKSGPFPYSFVKISIKIDIGHIWTQWKNANWLQHVVVNMSIILMWLKCVMFILIEIFHVHFDWLTSLCGNIYFVNEILIILKIMSKFSMGHCNCLDF